MYANYISTKLSKQNRSQKLSTLGLTLSLQTWMSSWWSHTLLTPGKCLRKLLKPHGCLCRIGQWESYFARGPVAPPTNYTCSKGGGACQSPGWGWQDKMGRGDPPIWKPPSSPPLLRKSVTYGCKNPAGGTERTDQSLKLRGEGMGEGLQGQGGTQPYHPWTCVL